MVGDSQIGKTSLMVKYVEGSFDEDYIQTLGADVNVFVDHSQIVQLACARKGIWGTSDLFGRVTTFKPKD